MTPKEKANELIEKAKKASSYQYQEYAGAHYTWFEHDIDTLRLIALITVEEILKILPTNEYLEDLGKNIENREKVYWQEVKQEIEKL